MTYQGWAVRKGKGSGTGKSAPAVLLFPRKALFDSDTSPGDIPSGGGGGEKAGGGGGCVGRSGSEGGGRARC